MTISPLRCLACLPLALPALLLSAGAASAAAVTVVVEGTEAGAPVLVSLCVGGLEPANCPRGEAAPGRAGAMRFDFPGVAPGRYAVAAFQDLDANGRLDRTPVGLPLEPYGFSNGVGRTAPPRFERAAVPVEGDTVIRLRIALPPPPR